MTNQIIGIINRKIRTISFDGNVSHPYLIGHPNELQLSDEVLKTHYLEYVSDNSAPFEAEEFEEFLAWLEDVHGYFNIITSDSMFQF